MDELFGVADFTGIEDLAAAGQHDKKDVDAAQVEHV